MSISQDWITNELEDTELEALHRLPLWNILFTMP